MTGSHEKLATVGAGGDGVRSSPFTPSSSKRTPAPAPLYDPEHISEAQADDESLAAQEFRCTVVGAHRWETVTVCRHCGLQQGHIPPYDDPAIWEND
jgi:hypothetical protein